MYREICQTDLSESLNSVGKIAKGVNQMHFTMLYADYCYIFIENFPQQFSSCTVKKIWILILANICADEAADDTLTINVEDEKHGLWCHEICVASLTDQSCF